MREERRVSNTLTTLHILLLLKNRLQPIFQLKRFTCPNWGGGGDQAAGGLKKKGEEDIPQKHQLKKKSSSQLDSITCGTGKDPGPHTQPTPPPPRGAERTPPRPPEPTQCQFKSNEIIPAGSLMTCCLKSLVRNVLQKERRTKRKSESEVAQSCPTLSDPMDCNLTGSSVHGIFQVRVLEWVAIYFSRGSSQTRGQTWVSRIPGRRFTI